MATHAAPKVNRSGILATAFMFVCAVYFLLPAWWLIVSTTKGPSTLYASEGFWFSQFHSVIPLVIAFLSLQRFWRSGLATGGVKL